MLDAHAHWPSGIRDTTEFPRVDITIDTSFREHLAAFLKLDGIGWNDYSDQREISGQAVADSRMRTNRKMYERMGVIYKDNDKIRLSRLGLQMKNLEHDLNEEKENSVRGSYNCSGYSFSLPVEKSCRRSGSSTLLRCAPLRLYLEGNA